MFFLFIITYIITGAPTRGVMAFRGSTLSLPGNTVRRLHSNATHEPAKIVTGSSIVWFDEPSSRRAICGTASPMNEMGPQKAVAVAVSSPVQSSIIIRVRFTFTPRLVAYISPRSRAFSGFIIRMARNSPAMEQIIKNGNRSFDTAEKSPIPHIT